MVLLDKPLVGFVFWVEGGGGRFPDELVAALVLRRFQRRYHAGGGRDEGSEGAEGVFERV